MSKYIYNPKSEIEKFGVRVYFVLVENFPQTFFVGGMVRDALLKRKIIDVDIATQAKPEDVLQILSQQGIAAVGLHKNFGSIIAKQGSLEVEITTFRKDIESISRYPKVQFVNTAKQDSQRRDFTINSLYLSLKPVRVTNFNNGILDIKKRLVRFIGEPGDRIRQDPLRIIRALRFALTLDFKLESRARRAIKNNLFLIRELSEAKINKEIKKLKNKNREIILKKVINSPKLLDKYFK